MDQELSMQELLSVDKIIELIEDKPPQERIILLAELKQQAAGFKIVREFNQVTKEAKQMVSRQEKGKQISDMPKCIEDNAGYQITELGIFNYLPMTMSMLEVCPYPLFITERYSDIEDGTEKVKLEFKRDGKWKQTIQPRNVIASSSKIVLLAEQAVGVTSENAKAVVKYLSDIESANRYTIPIKKATSRLGWTDYGFVPFIDDISFTGAETYAQLFNSFHEKGDRNTWLELSKLCMQETVPKIVIAASYASLLLKQIGVNGFCVHLWGESGRGKTVALMLGASVFGDADPKNGIIRNGKTTSNGIEPVLDFFNNVPVYYDELTTLSQDQITDMIYKFTQGQGKGRMTKSAAMQKTYTWNNVAVLSAEKPLADARTMSGAINRVISVYSEGSLFGDLDMVKIANTLKSNYGFGAKPFIEAVSNPTFEIKDIYKKHLDSIPSDIEQKQANAAAVLLTAFEIASKYVYDSDIQLTAEELNPYLAKRKDVSVSIRAYINLRGYINANYTYFDDSVINQSKWGRFGENNKVHIFYTRFQEWCQRNNYQETALLREWRNRGLIKTRNKTEFKNNARIDGKIFYDIITLNLDTEDDLVQSMQMEVIADGECGDQLPFPDEEDKLPF